MRSTASDISVRIGTRICALRGKRNLTLDNLAYRAQVSRTMLSRVERRESSPTAQLLGRVCGGLGVTLSVLFSETQMPVSPLSRRRDQPTWRDPATGYLRRGVSPAGTGSSVDIVAVEFPPGGSVAFDSLQLAVGDQHVWVLEGTLELALGDAVFRLEAGDCLMMHFDRPVVFRNPTKHQLRYAVIISHGAARA